MRLVLIINLLMILTILSPVAHGTVRLPPGLNDNNRSEILKIVGFGTTTKLLTEPYPLGGYPGFEVGVSIEEIPIDTFNYMGTQNLDQKKLTVPRLMAGKGLFNNVDAFIHFIPFTEASSLSGYGAMMRWSFYQATLVPASFSLIVHGSSSNLSNQLITQTTGLSLVTGFTFETFSFFLGGGKISTHGQFMSPDTGGQVITVREDGLHSFIGGVFHMDPFFAAIQFDQYQQPMISTRIGVRY